MGGRHFLINFGDQFQNNILKKVKTNLTGFSNLSRQNA